GPAPPNLIASFHRHPAAYLLQVPSRERGEGASLGRAPLGEPGAIRVRRPTLIRALPLVPQDVAPLEAPPVRGLLEHQVLGEVRTVVSNVEPRDEDAAGPSGRDPHAAPGPGRVPERSRAPWPAALTRGPEPRLPDPPKPVARE